MLSRHGTKIRVALAVLGFTGALFLPWWVPLISMILLALRYPAPEVPLIGLCIDMLWLPQGAFWGMPVFTLIAMALLLVCSPVRRQLLI